VPLVLASVQDDFYDWLNREAPDYLRALASGWSDPREAFAAYLRTGDQGALFSWPYRKATGGVPAGAPFFGFRDGTGRQLAADTIEHLRRYFATRSTGTTRLCWLSEDPNDDTPQPIGTAQLRTMLVALPHDDLVALTVAMQPLLQGLADGVLPFGSRSHRVVVVTPQPDDRGSADPVPLDPPALPKEEIPPTREEAIRLQLKADGIRTGQSIPEQTFGRRIRARCKIADAVPPRRNPPRGWGDKHLARLAREMLANEKF
jgi:hypothetical protein